MWAVEAPRRAQLPPHWHAIRRAVLRRDRGVCQLRGPGCTLTATDIDHIGGNLDHRLTNLRSLCHPCHVVHTREQATASRRQRWFRAPEPHPNAVAR